MKDIDELRHALDAETGDLAVHLPPETVRRRARRLRARRSVGTAVAAVVAAGALAAPWVLFGDGSDLGYEAGGPTSPSACAVPPVDKSQEAERWVGPLVETGVTLDAPNVNTRYDVLLGLLSGTVYASPGPGAEKRRTYALVVAFRDQKTGAVQNWDIYGLGSDPSGDFRKGPGDPPHQFRSGQLTLGPHSVLDVGLYSRSAHRITVASEGRATEARTARNAETGWTFFWVQRAAAPLPPGHNTTPVEYTGPERLTITAYGADGQVQHTVTGGFHTGHSIQNPRDHQAAPEPEASTTAEPCPTSSGK